MYVPILYGKGVKVIQVIDRRFFYYIAFSLVFTKLLPHSKQVQLIHY